MNKKLISFVLLLLITLFSTNCFANEEHTGHKEYQSKTLTQLAKSFFETTGINALVNPKDGIMTSEPNPKDARPMTHLEQSWGRIIMFAIVFLLFY